MAAQLPMPLVREIEPRPRNTSETFAPSIVREVQRPSVKGKFLYVGDQKLWVKGVTYGAFRPDANGNEYHDLEVIERDFAQMAAHGFNTVRIPHTMPPRSLLDCAERHGLYVMVGLSAEQYVGFLIDRKKKAPDLDALVRSKVRGVAGHPALLCYAIGNEIQAPVVRWIGRRRVERYLERICRAIKREDPKGIVTYVNYPTTEYLQLPFLDFLAFNVYLESQEELAAYLLRLQNIADERPLIMSEVGLDSLRNGEEMQAISLDWQVRTAFSKGCAGVFVFAWTDEWHRAGAEVDDWAFGLTTRERQPKAALSTVMRALNDVPFPRDSDWPRVSVIVCSYNGASTIRDTMEGLQTLDYQNYEVIVIDDGSRDQTAEIVSEYPFKLVRTENRGLSAARNLGLELADGEVVAYIDDDAYPDPHWLQYLANAFLKTNGRQHSLGCRKDDLGFGHVGIGGPNIVPTSDGMIAQSVAHSPGGPTHVLLTDAIAEHIPGCNMAFKKAALDAVGGFDERFRSAGDDVDICWRLQERGWTLGYCPGAVMWHHRRNSVRAYWKQQFGYGKAEALLEAKWPQKFNSAGHQRFSGRIYGYGPAPIFRSGARIYHGIWGTASFQSLYESSPGLMRSLTLMPEWYLFVAFLLGLSVLSLTWKPLLAVSGTLFIAAITVCVVQACAGAMRASWYVKNGMTTVRPRFFLLTSLLHFTQPLARLWGRIKHGLTLWKSPNSSGFVFPSTKKSAEWTEDWIDPERRLAAIEDSLQKNKVRYKCGHEFAQWDFEILGGLFGATRLLMAVEDHGAGSQYVRKRYWPHIRNFAWLCLLMLLVPTVVTAIQASWIPFAFLTGCVLSIVVLVINQCGRSLATSLALNKEMCPTSLSETKQRHLFSELRDTA